MTINTYTMENIPSSDHLIKELIATLEAEIANHEEQLTSLSFTIKSKKAKLRKYKSLSDDVAGTV